MSEALTIAQHYFALSNARRLDDIEALFTPSSTYSSATTGVYLGARQIMAMQREFFSGYSTMGWTVQDMREVRPGIVCFDFTFDGMTTSGEHVTRDGIEYVIVYAGKLQHIEVRGKDDGGV